MEPAEEIGAIPSDLAAGDDQDPPPAPHERTHTFDAVSPDEPVPESVSPPLAEAWLSPSWLDDVVDDDAAIAAAGSDATSEPDVADHEDDEAMPEVLQPEPDVSQPEPEVPEPEVEVPQPEPEPVTSAGDLNATTEVSQPEPIFRTPGPWNWPLAEPDGIDLEPAAVAASAPEDTPPALENGAEPEFFHRDEPVGSKYVDFDEVRDELVQIGVVWLGETNAVQVTALLSNTRSTIDDFVATIDTIRGLHIEGQDPASIQAMAREMHQQAAERLSGA